MASDRASEGIGQSGPVLQDITLNIEEQLPAEQVVPGFDGWEEYPGNLKTYNNLTKNLSLYSKRLNDANNLFCKPGAAEVEILPCDIPVSCDISEMRFYATDEGELEQILMDKAQLPFKVFTLTQEHSWRELDITEPMLRKLFSFLQVFPDFLEVVHFFSRRTKEPFSFSGGFASKIRGSTETCADNSELCFNLFYVERHGRDNTSDPWSLRQMAFYLQFDFKRHSSTHIIIQPLERVDALVIEVIRGGYVNKANPLPLQLAFLTAAMENWADYTEALELELKGLRGCLSLSDDEWNDFRKNGAGKINYSDYRKLQRYFRDKVLRAMSVLDSNSDVLLGLQRYNTQLRKLKLLPYDTTFRESCEILEGHKLRIRGLRGNLRSILQIAEGSVKLVQTLLDIRNDTTIQEYNDATRSLLSTTRDLFDTTRALHDVTHGLLGAAQEARGEAVKMTEITQRTKYDSRTMRILTILAVMYLPGTFVATLFGMNIIHSDISSDSATKSSFLVTKEIWIFIIVTFFLTVITIGSWWASERYFGPRESAQIQKKTLTQLVKAGAGSTPPPALAAPPQSLNP